MQKRNYSSPSVEMFSMRRMSCLLASSPIPDDIPGGIWGPDEGENLGEGD